MGYNGFIIPYEAAVGGYNANDNIDSVAPSELIEASAIRYDGNTWRKAGGIDYYDANVISGAPTCLGGIDWWPTTSTQRQVTVWSDGNIYKEVSGDIDSVTLESGLTYTNPVVMLAAGKESPGNNGKLLIFSAGIAPRLLTADGATTGAISNPSPDWSGANQPRGAILHDSRVCAWYEHSIYFSTLSDHSDFLTQAPPTFSIMPGSADYISACYSLGTTRLYIFKYPHGIYFCDTSNITSYWLNVTTVREDIGIAGPNAITRVGQLGTWFMGSDGHIYSLDLISDPDVDPKNACITSGLNLENWIRDNVNLTRMPHARLIYNPTRQEVWAIYSGTGSSVHNKVLVFDVRYPTQIRTSIDDRGSLYNAAWMSRVSSKKMLYTAGNTGFVFKQDQSTKSQLGSAYRGSFWIPHSDFGWANPALTNKKKRLDFIGVRVKSTGAYYLSIDIYVDGSYSSTETILIGGSGSALDDNTVGLVPNTTKSDFTLSGDSYVRHKIKVGGIGETFGFRCYNAGNGEDFAVSKFDAYVRTLGETGEI